MITQVVTRDRGDYASHRNRAVIGSGAGASWIGWIFRPLGRNAGESRGSSGSGRLCGDADHLGDGAGCCGVSGVVSAAGMDPTRSSAPPSPADQGRLSVPHIWRGVRRAWSVFPPGAHDLGEALGSPAVALGRQVSHLNGSWPWRAALDGVDGGRLVRGQPTASTAFMIGEDPSVRVDGSSPIMNRTLGGRFSLRSPGAPSNAPARRRPPDLCFRLIRSCRRGPSGVTQDGGALHPRTAFRVIARDGLHRSARRQTLGQACRICVSSARPTWSSLRHIAAVSMVAVAHAELIPHRFVGGSCL